MTFTELTIRRNEFTNEGLTIYMSASEILNGGQYSLSTQLVKLDYLVIPTNNAVPQFFQKLIPFTPHTDCLFIFSFISIGIADDFYHISYLWFSGLSVLTSFVVGVLVSLAFGRC